MDREKVIKALGEDVSREGLKDTPRHVADAYAELLSGTDKTAEEDLSRTFAADGGGVVIEKDIWFSSACEHHLMPFFGKMHIAYIPQGRVAGLSKLARTVEIFSKRLQLQKRLTSQVAEENLRCLKPEGVFVICEAEHTCMTCRGIKKAGSKTVTYCAKGNFPQELRGEVLAAIK